MYGGLFGDLPEAKKSSQKTNETQAQSSSNVEAAAPSNQGDSSAPAGASAVAQKPQEPQSSIVKSVGVSGTAVAFVPTAALKPRKRPAPGAIGAKRTVATTKTVQVTSATVKQESIVSNTESTIDVPSEETNAVTAPSEASEATTPKHQSLSSRYSEEHRQRLRQEALDDPYDPLVPNDLLVYWEQKAVQAEREQLERRRQEQLQQQQDLLQRLQEERQELERQGNVQGLLESEQRSRGRGRGVSNLPAWLVAKQKEEQKDEQEIILDETDV